ncbi:tRNA and rRNA cytosine-C5-methylase [Secundilactobacillus oryzae JCM 18671]|uniref:16S rRNA (cytosine(967)-C(5))-methyltransferase n=1 Tax=Secundilactobacillus oryzae JCM 18671 TaxID=1291743 RepID=A0A081BFV4_9LACO|nr:16S rRNA (cytosine(967)-C(5))-methyltransferase RsmB [Secundilactobacillus oryzae]GAK46922.1 tRNA and rRNA cytosine-C5-methylase [Secundilactobacillus oryzae JCM 18671]
MQMTNNPRFLAVQALAKIKAGAYSNLQLNNVINDHQLKPADVNLLTTIVYGVIQHRLTLAFYLKPFIKNPQKVQPWVRELLYTALFQELYLDRIPKRAIFNETIEIAKQNGHEGIRKFVTGVLHQMDRSGLPEIDTIEDPVEKLEVKYSVPRWLIEKLQEQRGEAKTLAILKKINQAANQSIRVNPKQIAVADAITKLQEEGYDVRTSEVASDALVVSGRSANQSELFKNGQITIQDESAMLPAESMMLSETMQVLDACAAPGGKTTQIAAYLNAERGGKVTALDIHDHKVNLIMQNAKRLHVESAVDAIKLDARKVSDQFDDEQFDRILVDAPCSGLGLIRRKPEIRYEKTLTDSEHLQQIQLKILQAVAPKVKKAGILVYSTCTILNEENQAVVDQFLDNHPDFKSVKIQTKLNLKQDRESDYLEIFPDDYDSDGFFISGFQRLS